MRAQNLHFRLLVPIWGDSYIKKFFKICARSIFTEKNLEIFSKFKSYEVVFLTNRISEAVIYDCAKSFNFNVRIIYIDDILNLKYYGLILPIAATRGINATTVNTQQDTAYIFINADFLVSDNTFNLIYEKLNEGYNGVLCQSFRCVEESAVEHLTNTNDFSERNLVKVCMQNLHPTVIASLINQNTFYNSSQWAFNFLVGEETMLTVSMNPHDLCIKPEVDYTHVNGPWDYAFNPSMIPSGNYYYVSDSDEMFLLELSPEKQDSEYLNVDKVNNYKIVDRVSSLLMKHKLKFLDHACLTHAGEISFDITNYNKLLKEYVKSIVSDIPVWYFDHFSLYDQHHFWIFNLMQVVSNYGNPKNFPELNLPLLYEQVKSGALKERQRVALMGTIDEKAVNKKLNSIIAKEIDLINTSKIISDGAVTLVVCSGPLQSKYKKYSVEKMSLQKFLVKIRNDLLFKQSLGGTIVLAITINDFYDCHQVIKNFIKDVDGSCKVYIDLTFNPYRKVLKTLRHLFLLMNINAEQGLFCMQINSDNKSLGLLRYTILRVRNLKSKIKLWGFSCKQLIKKILLHLNLLGFAKQVRHSLSTGKENIFINKKVNFLVVKIKSQE